MYGKCGVMEWDMIHCAITKRANMLVLLAGIFVVHIATVVMLFVATISNVWLQSSGGTTFGSLGIWMACSNGVCQNIFGTTIIAGNGAAMRAVEAFMILAIIFSGFALCAFIAHSSYWKGVSFLHHWSPDACLLCMHSDCHFHL
ncbi:hypothetical protein GDO86_007526 [Hymenochirus boettgeri]|uniref:Uncharacterized protein n=1 Tax=Hymenochirus boettgeri TaxID=247094 RepID=A0A8T2J272_9PIPI|nr:hypothetical protein GDO86_007526 [Hymenochirus boettgeri]